MASASIGCAGGSGRGHVQAGASEGPKRGLAGAAAAIPAEERRTRRLGHPRTREVDVMRQRTRRDKQITRQGRSDRDVQSAHSARTCLDHVNNKTRRATRRAECKTGEQGSARGRAPMQRGGICRWFGGHKKAPMGCLPGCFPWGIGNRREESREAAIRAENTNSQQVGVVLCSGSATIAPAATSGIGVVSPAARRRCRVRCCTA